MQPLTLTTPGRQYEIKWMFGVPEVLQFLHERQVREGSIISVICKSDDCLIIGSGSRRIALGCDIARRIQVGICS